MIEDIMGTILSSSITGASLVLIIYSIAIPNLKILIYKNAKKESFLKKEVITIITQIRNKENNGEAMDENDIKQLEDKLKQVSSFENIPSYLNKYCGYATLGGFMLSAIMSFAWFLNYFRESVQEYIAFPFALALLIFFIMGLLFIHDISQSVTKEYNDMIRKLFRNDKL
jgi:hypothetical protein